MQVCCFKNDCTIMPEDQCLFFCFDTSDTVSNYKKVYLVQNEKYNMKTLINSTYNLLIYFILFDNLNAKRFIYYEFCLQGNAVYVTGLCRFKLNILDLCFAAIMDNHVRCFVCDTPPPVHIINERAFKAYR